MKLFDFLNRKVTLTKTQAYLIFFCSIAAGVLTAIYGQKFLYYLGFNLLAENFWLISLVLVIIFSVITLVNLLFSRKEFRVSNNSFDQQINELERALEGIKSLELFIDEQKIKLRQNKETIDELNSKKEKLRPIVESHRQIVDSILNAHSENQSKKNLRERVIGFFLGLLSSSIASLIIWYFT